MNRTMTGSNGKAAVITGEDAPSRLLLICEHASNAFPAPWDDGLGLDAAGRQAHVAWDPGAVGLAQGLAVRLGAALVQASASRLIHDLNRAPDSPGAMPPRSEVHDIPGNQALDAAERRRRVDRIYIPFHADLAALIARRIARGPRPVLVTVHSFTPVWFGQPRAVELGVIHDDTRPGAERMAAAVVAAARAQTGLRTELNAPYSAADGVTHLLRRHAVPYGLDHVMLEIRNDLIADTAAEAAMADQLAPVLATALAALEGEG